MRAVTKEVKGRDRAAYFARREAAKVLRVVLGGDAQRRAVANIKSLVFKASVRNKKATFALVCETLKHLPLIKKVLLTSNVLTGKWRRQAELLYVTAYDIFFGKSVASLGDVEKHLLQNEASLRLSLTSCKKENPNILQNATSSLSSGIPRPRYVRVNTLKIDVESAFQKLKAHYEVKHDDLIPDLLILPPGTDLHRHPLVLSGSLFLQGKSSCIPALALSPCPDWEVLDACAAPGNKTVQLAALMKGNGKVFACELNSQRLRRLKETVKLSGTANIEIQHGDFLSLDSSSPRYSKIKAILLDPSCSGSGTIHQRLDHLLPSTTAGRNIDSYEGDRLEKLAAFQKKCLLKALSFPSVDRIVYSTCSIHQLENEDVIHSVLADANALNFYLEAPFPEWPQRGLPVYDEAPYLLRVDPSNIMEGFFVALFVRRHEDLNQISSSLFGRAEMINTRNQKPKKIPHSNQQDNMVDLSCKKLKKNSLRKSSRTSKKYNFFTLLPKGFRTSKIFRLMQVISSRRLKSRMEYRRSLIDLEK